jgi:hypothetical protein
MKPDLPTRTQAEAVAYFRLHPPSVGSCGQAYRTGFAGKPNRLFVAGSMNAAAYRAGELNCKACELAAIAKLCEKLTKGNTDA